MRSEPERPKSLLAPRTGASFAEHAETAGAPLLLDAASSAAPEHVSGAADEPRTSAGVGASRRPRPRRRPILVGGVVAAAVLLVGGGIGASIALHGTALRGAPQSVHPGAGPSARAAAVSNRESSVAPITASSEAVASPTPTPTPTPDQAAATAELNRMADTGLANATFDGRWVDQVSSKNSGIRDPLETTASGSHVFAATDILAESLGMRTLVSDPADVFVLRSTDVSPKWHSADGRPYWVTFVDEGFSSQAAARAWCGSAFAQLTPAQRADTCLPKQLERSDG